MDDCQKKLEIEISRRENLENAYKVKASSYENLKKHLDVITVTDQITGTFNRVKMDSLLEQELARCNRYGNNLCIVLISIKDFDKIENSVIKSSINLGLRRLASIITECLRNTDYIGRWKDDSFLVILTETSTDQVEIAEPQIAFINRINSVLKTSEINDIGFFSCNFGVSGNIKGDDYLSITARAVKDMNK
jgi:diguanylate cyclase (GGDEF)-like protein